MAGNKKIKQKKPGKRPNNKAPSLLMVPSAPSAMGAIDRGKRVGLPVIRQVGSLCTVRNYEQVAAFPTGNTSFQAAGALINPGIASVFPWLSAIATNFSKFRFRYLRFFFSGSCPTSTTGKVWINIDYDSLDTAPSSLAQVLQSEDSCSGPAWFGGVVSSEKAFDKRLPSDSNIFVDADVSKMGMNWYMVRTTLTDLQVSLSGTPTGGLGTLTLAGNTVDSAALPCHVFYGNNAVTSSTVPGELYVAYEIQLIEPTYAAGNN